MCAIDSVFRLRTFIYVRVSTLAQNALYPCLSICLCLNASLSDKRPKTKQNETKKKAKQANKAEHTQKQTNKQTK